MKKSLDGTTIERKSKYLVELGLVTLIVPVAEPPGPIGAPPIVACGPFPVNAAVIVDVFASSATFSTAKLAELPTLKVS